MSLSPPTKKQNFGMTSEWVHRHLKERQKKLLEHQQKSKQSGTPCVQMNPRNRQLWMNIDGVAADTETASGHQQMDNGKTCTRGRGRGRGSGNVSKKPLLPTPSWGFNSNGSSVVGVTRGVAGSSGMSGLKQNMNMKIEGHHYVGHLRGEAGVYSNKLSSGCTHQPSSSSAGTPSLSLSRLLQSSSPSNQNLSECSQQTLSTSTSAPSPWTHQLAQILNSEGASAVQHQLSNEAKRQAENSFGWFLPTDSFLNPIIPVLPRIEKKQTKSKDEKVIETPFLKFTERSKFSKNSSYIPFISKDGSDDE